MKKLLAFLIFPITLIGLEIHIVVPEGEDLTFHISDETTAVDLKALIEEHTGIRIDEQKLMFNDFEVDGQATRADYTSTEYELLVNTPIALSLSRDYLAGVAPHEASDIHYIVTTLANVPTIGLAFYSGSLDQAGDRINHVHPFRFLQTVFTSEELKVCIRNVKNKGWVWNRFMSGLSESLDEEAAAGNLKPEFIHDFAAIVGIDPSKIVPHIEKRRWKSLVSALIKHIPREGDSGRYDM